MAKNIVLAAIDLQHDGSDRNIAEEALSLARDHDAELHLVFVIPDEQIGYVQAYIPAEMKADVEKDAKADLDAFGAALDSDGTTVRSHVLRGIVYDQIVKLSDRVKASIVVVGAHKPGFMDFFLGPNAARLARHALCSVMIVRPGRNE
jgi:nucleotide-binding universal stress UspA family protein